MAKIVSGVRYARSFVTPAAQATVSREVDFDLGARLGIKVLWTLTSIFGVNNPTADVNLEYVASVHAENDAIEDLPLATGEDEDNADSEVFHQHYASHIHTESAAGNAAFAFQSNLYIPHHQDDLILASNPTFSGKSESSSGSAAMALLMAYRYVELTNAELVGALTSRR